MLKLRPNFEIFSMFILLSTFSTNFTGPSHIGLKNRLLLGLKIAIIPLLLHIANLYLSERSIMDSCKKLLIPCDATESRSISPIRKPPSFARPLNGCRVKAVFGPRAR